MANNDCHDIGMFVHIDEEEDKEFICPIGSGVLREAVSLSECGHTFCRNCITKWLKNNSTCPIDRKPVSLERIIPNWPLCNMVNKLKVYCYKSFNNVPDSNNANIDYFNLQQQDPQQNIWSENDKCQWQGQLQQLLPHRQKDCLFEKVSCPFDGCPEKSIQKRFLKQHTDTCQHTPVSCEFCGTTIRLMEKQNHIDNCPQKLIPCPQNCGQMYRPVDMPLHIKDNCPYTMLDCPCKPFGCQFTLKREELDSHIKQSVDSHIVYFANGLQEQNVVITVLKEQLESETKKREELETMIAEIQSRVKNLEKPGSFSRNSDSMIYPQTTTAPTTATTTTTTTTTQSSQPSQPQPAPLTPSLSSSNILANTSSQQPISPSLRPRLFVIGGHDGAAATSRFEAYDPVTKSWTTLPSMKEKRCCHAAVAYEGKIYVLGGSGTNQLNSVEIFDPQANAWSAGPSMLSKRNCTAGAVLNRRLYVVGGHDGVSRLNSVEYFDPESRTWNVAPQMGAKRSSPAVAVLDNKLYAIGGGDGSTQLNTVECFDPQLGRWTYVAPMTTKRLSPAASVLNGYLYVIGGFDSSHYFNSVERYDPKSNSWSAVTPMISKRGSASAAVLLDKLYVVGGYDNQTSRLNSVEYYDPQTNTWATTAPMGAKCGNIAVVTLPAQN